MDREKLSKGTIVTFSIGLILCGFLMVLNPVFSILTLYLVGGILALARGIMLIVHFVTRKELETELGPVHLTVGVLLTLFGLTLLFYPGILTGIFGFAMGFWFVVDGVMGLTGKKTSLNQDKGVSVIQKILSVIVIVGGISLFFNPLMISYLIPVIVGINALALGTSSLIIALSKKTFE